MGINWKFPLDRNKEERQPLLETKEPEEIYDITDSLETKEEKRIRKRSVYIVTSSMFIMFLGYSVILTSVWPYLKELSPTVDKTFLGWVVAANPLGLVIFCPLVGWWSNHLGSIRIPCIIGGILYFLGSACYSLLALFPEGQEQYWMIFSRFVVGISSAIIAPCRSYLSAATTLQERTKIISLASFLMTVGLIIGPSLQAALTPLGTGEHDENGNFLLTWNMFTVCSWVSAGMGLVNAVMFLPGIFQEVHIAEKEIAMLAKQKIKTTETEEEHPSIDKGAAWTCMFAYFMFLFNFVLIETLGTPLLMDQFGWTESLAVQSMGIVMAVGGVLSGFVFAFTVPLAKRYDERNVMIIGGVIPMILGRIFFFPIFSSELPPIQGLPTQVQPINSTYLLHEAISTATVISEPMLNGTSLIFENTSPSPSPIKEDELVGCPPSQEWCFWTPALTLWQVAVGFALHSLFHPVCVTMTHSLFSKILGARPQGTWMGFFTSIGSLSRFSGPLFVSYIYTNFGTVWIFTFLVVTMVLTLVFLLYLYKRLLPMHDMKKSKGSKNP